ncbi:hypothetical protein Bca52824_096764, partial [Brassica carinata]
WWLRFSSYWITFRPGEKTTDYHLEQKSLSLVDVPSPCLGSAVSVGSEIYFIGGQSVPSTKNWILDTRSGHLRTAPSMKVGRMKIYVIGGSYEDSKVEVFDPETQTWDFAGEEKVKSESKFSVSMKQKVYMVGKGGRVSSYSPSEGINNESTEVLSDKMKFLCVVGISRKFEETQIWFLEFPRISRNSRKYQSGRNIPEIRGNGKYVFLENR